VPPLPASTTLATLRSSGHAVVCALTMDNLFGTGRILPGWASSPRPRPPRCRRRCFAAAMVVERQAQVIRAERWIGPAGAPVAAAVALINALRTNRP